MVHYKNGVTNRRIVGCVGVWAIWAACGAARAEAAKAGATSAKCTVAVSGHAFHFGPRGGRVKGGEVTVLERPELRTLTGKRGAWRIDGLAPGSEATFVFKHRGYFTTQTATFKLGDGNLERVTFQVPPDLIVKGFGLVLGFTPDPDFCQLASTVTRVAESMYGSKGPTHGEPGATVTIDPPLPAKHGPIYFNLKLFDNGAQVIWPDRSLKQTTLDGGVLYIDVPPGEYVLRAHKPGVEFKPVKVKCRAGVLVNASPPCGLQALNRVSGKATSAADSPTSSIRIPDRHPYLAITRQDVARAKRLTAKFPWAKRAMESLIDAANDEVARPFGKLPKQGDWGHRGVSGRLFEVGVAHAMTGDRRYAEWVRDVLLRYADIYPGLPLWRKRCKMLSASPLMEATWFVPLVQAYDLVADSEAFTDAQRRHVEKDLLRAAMVCFKIDDFEKDDRIKDLHYRCYNFQAWHISAIGLAGLALKDAELVDYAVNSPYGFKHLVAHDLRDDGLFWERSIGYHHFVIAALQPFTEAMMHCGVDLYNLSVPNDRSKDEDCHYVTDTSDKPKSFRYMFEAPFYAMFPDRTYIAMGDSGRGPLRANAHYLIAYHRCRGPRLSWLQFQDGPSGGGRRDAGRVGFLHYYRYGYRYERIRLNGQPVTWGRVDGTYRQQGDALLADDGGSRQPDRYLLNDADLGDFALEWTMTRLRDSGKDERAWVVYHVDGANTEFRKTFALPGYLPELNRPYRFRLEVSNRRAKLVRDGEIVSTKPSSYRPKPSWQWLVYEAPQMGWTPIDSFSGPTWGDGTFANTGVFENGCSLFPSSGLAVLRQRAGDFTRDSNATAVAFSYGPYGGGHGHPDKLSIVVYAQGRQWTPHFGSMPYESKWKAEWTSQTISHNTVVVDGVSQKPTGDRNVMWPADHFRSKVLGKLERFDPERKRVSACCDSAYDGIGLRRAVQLVDNCVIDVFDVGPADSKSTPQPRQFDYVLHVDGKLSDSTVKLAACGGALGDRCGYQHVQQRQTGVIDGVGALTFAAGDKRFRVWVAALDTTPMRVLIADGLTNNPNVTMPMLVLRRKGAAARFVTVMEPIETAGPVRAVRVETDHVILVRAAGETRVGL